MLLRLEQCDWHFSASASMDESRRLDRFLMSDSNFFVPSSWWKTMAARFFR